MPGLSFIIQQPGRARRTDRKKVVEEVGRGPRAAQPRRRLSGALQGSRRQEAETRCHQEGENLDGDGRQVWGSIAADDLHIQSHEEAEATSRSLVLKLMRAKWQREGTAGRVSRGEQAGFSFFFFF